MSAEARLYRWSRRLLIAVGALAVLGAVVLASLTVGIGWSGRDVEPARVAAAPGGPELTVGDAARIVGTSLVRISVSAGESRGGSYSYSAGDQRNVIVIDERDGRSWRLLPGNDRRIDRVDWFPASITAPGTGLLADLNEHRDEPSAPVRYFAMLVDAPRGHDLIIGTVDGTRRQTVMSGIDGVDSSWMRGDDQLALVLRDQGQLQYRIVDMTTLRVAASRQVPIQ